MAVKTSGYFLENRPLNDLFQRSFPFIFLAIIFLFTYALFVKIPYLGFFYTYRDEIAATFTPQAELPIGARILAVDGTPLSERRESWNSPLFPNTRPGETLDLTIAFEGQIRQVAWTVPSNSNTERLARLFSTWWLPLIFWLSGTLIWYLIRPRNTTWMVLFAFQMLIALYLADLNGPFLGNLYFSAPLARLLGCLSLPIFLHLHWLFPRPPGNLSSRAAAASYGTATILGLGTALELLPAAISIFMSMLAVLGSLTILLWKLIIQKPERRTNSFVLVMFFVIMLPGLGTTIGYEYFGANLDYFAFTGTYYPMGALPSIYFLVMLQMSARGLKRELRNIRRVYSVLVVISSILILAIVLLLSRERFGLDTHVPAFMLAILSIFSFAVALLPLLDGINISRHVDGSTLSLGPDLQLRANRLLTPYIFLVLFGFTLIGATGLLYLLFRQQTNLVWSNLMTALIVSVLTLALYPVFQEIVERYMFGIARRSEVLVESHARRITTTLKLTDLARLHTEDILPSVMVRTSGLLYIDQANHIRKLYGPDDLQPAAAEFYRLARMLPREGDSRPLVSNQPELLDPDWIRVLIPLRISGRLTGIWLLGPCDPDDDYSLEILAILKTIANQTAIALSNILQTSQLLSVYREDIDRAEAERVQIAHDLHDEVLNQMVSQVMKSSSEGGAEEFIDAHQQVMASLREIILRLRPAVLDYGLGHAFHEMAAHLREGIPQTELIVDLPHGSPRYPREVENHTYRIVQQVCENAVRHARASRICLSGRLEGDRIDLSVEDDGVGFSFDGADHTRLVESRRFGLVGIHERAELIRATLLIDSSPGAGTLVRLQWESDRDA